MPSGGAANPQGGCDMDEKPTANSIWEHVKTQNLYVIKTVAIDATNSRDGTPVVVYARWRPGPLDLDTAGPFVRELTEFCDGRFRKIHDRPPSWGE